MKINPDKLTDFETQLATMFELRIGDVSTSPFELRVPDMPLIAITRWGARVVPPQPGTTATWYRALTWRGKILARQLHRRACARVVDEKAPANEAMEDAKQQAALSGLNTAAAGLARGAPGMSKQQIMGMAQHVPNMQAARPLNPVLNIPNATFFGIPLNELVNAGVDPSLIADAKKGDSLAMDHLYRVAESLQLKKL